MDWKVACYIPMVLWGFYLVFGSLANNIHGPRVSMVAEATAMMAMAGVMLLMGGTADFRKVTQASLVFVILMAILSAVGLGIQFYAFSIAPPDKQGAVGMISGMFPVVGSILFSIMGTLKLQGGAPMSGRQWLAVATGALTLWLAGSK